MNSIGIRSARDCAAKAHPADWLVRGFFERGCTYALDDSGYGPEARTACLDLALAIANGTPFFGLTAKKRQEVVYADFMSDEAFVDRQLRARGTSQGELPGVKIVTDAHPAAWLCTYIKYKKPPTVVVASDILDALGVETHDAHGSLRMLHDLRRLARRANTGLWLLCRHERAERMLPVFVALADGWAELSSEAGRLVLGMATEFAEDVRLLVHEAARAERADAAAEVYFIQSGANGPVKIGASTSTRKRLGDLQVANPVKLNIIATIPSAGWATERRLHRRFAAERLHGEWFRPSERLLDWIKANALLWPTG